MDDLSSLARRLVDAARTAPAAGAAVVSKGALNIKNDARANAEASSGAHARQYPATITYDLERGAMATYAEIGPEKRGQGNLGVILEHGSEHNGGHRDLGRAADAEELRTELAIDAMASKLL